jgi:hypothetical protein
MGRFYIKVKSAISSEDRTGFTFAVLRLPTADSRLNPQILPKLRTPSCKPFTFRTLRPWSNICHF